MFRVIETKVEKSRSKSKTPKEKPAKEEAKVEIPKSKLDELATNIQQTMDAHVVAVEPLRPHASRWHTFSNARVYLASFRAMDSGSTDAARSAAL